MQVAVDMRGITKRFGTVLANDKVDLTCHFEEIVCLLGENGAGKTTLMNILYGLYNPDEGEIWYQGKKTDISSPRHAIHLGIQMVHQHFMLVPTLTVADNIVLGKEPLTKGVYDRKRAADIVNKLSEEFGLKVDPDRRVDELSVGEQQRVEIVKALYQGANVLILDEPTAVLTPQEVDELFVIMDQLRKSGKSIIMITHKLKETMAISDRVYVLRSGQMVGERKTSETSIDELSEMMVGRKIAKPVPRRYENQDALLLMKNVSMVGSSEGTCLRDISLEINKKEIVGIAGVEGNGQMELVEVLSGINRKWKGSITVGGADIHGLSPAKLAEIGISIIHADRHQNSVAKDLMIPENYLLGNQDKSCYDRHGIFLNWKQINADALHMMQTYDVRPCELGRSIQNFSGGNQQKFVVGREITRNPVFLVAAHPTRGVDISASEFIHRQLLEQKDEGSAILLISSDLDELLTLSDQIAVMYSGKIVAFGPATSFDEYALGKLMGGGSDD